MNWQAEKYESWFATRTGRFVLEQEQLLLRSMIADWPRRRRRLLEMGCGTGLFLELFWRAGFEVTGLDPSPAMLKAARSRMETKADLHLGQAEHVHFDDKRFDYTALITVLEFCRDPEAVLREAYRVTRKGVLIAFLNRHSLYYYTHGPGLGKKRGGSMATARWFSITEIRRLARCAMGDKPARSRSVLLGPPATWGRGTPWRQINSLTLPPVGGAFAVLRVDLKGEKPLTPLPAWKTEPASPL
jgi:ubiquinone/menaquinone biosynthesis C-methylase UbiE